jgi:hypothetical protein
MACFFGSEFHHENNFYLFFLFTILSHDLLVKLTYILVPCRKHWRQCRSGHNTGHWSHWDAAVGHASVDRIRESDDISGEGFGVYKC